MVKNMLVFNSVTVDITKPIAGYVTDGLDPNVDLMYSSQAASFASHWADYYDPESGITDYKVD